MAFLNGRDAIIVDTIGDIYSFRLCVDGIELVVHEKDTDLIDRSIIVRGDILEYDVTINEMDKIDLICKRKDGIYIYSLKSSEWVESKIYKDENRDICGLKIISSYEQIHIFYYMISLKDKTKLSIYHHYLNQDKWNTIIVKDIYRSEIIKPIEIIKDKDDILIAYYDLGEYSEDIFLSKFDKKESIWGKAINLTHDNKVKMYLDLLKIDEFIHISYSEYEDENLIIKHKRVKVGFDKVIEKTEHILSDQANCTNPTLILEGDLLWNVWTEYENVVSAYSKDSGEIWSNPYVWKESKKDDFTRYKFNNNQKSVRDKYKMNYCFSRSYPELLLLGFGNLEGAIESLKKKEGFDDKINKVEIKEIEESLDKKINKLIGQMNLFESELTQMKRQVRVMDTKFKNTELGSMEKRISDIENHLNRRRGSFLLRS